MVAAATPVQGPLTVLELHMGKYPNLAGKISTITLQFKEK